MEVTRDDVPVMYVVSVNGPEGASEAFKRLEDAIEWKLKGRRFYGTEQNSEYRSCLATIEGEDPEKLGFPTWTIPGGKYLRSKITDWEKHIPEIKSEFDKLVVEAGTRLDPSRPFIEFYRSLKELYIFVPLK